MSPCSALSDGKCRNGFPVAPVCSHTEIDYDQPKRTYSGFPHVPFCLDEINCARLWPEKGAPSLGEKSGE